MLNKLPHIKLIDIHDKWNPSHNKIYYDVTEEDIQNYPLLRKLKKLAESTSDCLYIDKDKTKAYILSNFGDEAIFDIKSGEMISFSFGY